MNKARLALECNTIACQAIPMSRIPNFSIRVPPELRAELERLAKEEHRTLANYIIAVLEEHVKTRRRSS
jgi:predicted HicB family RNase H-like nuclease